MPGGDRTGPWGAGPMTGRGAGYCAGHAVPGYVNAIGGGFGRGGGFGGGRRGGRGYRNRYWATGIPGWAQGGPAMVPDVPGGYAYGAAAAREELEVLKSQAQYFEGALEDIKKRIQELETASTAEEK